MIWGHGKDILSFIFSKNALHLKLQTEERIRNESESWSVVPRHIETQSDVTVVLNIFISFLNSIHGLIDDNVIPLKTVKHSNHYLYLFKTVIFNICTSLRIPKDLINGPLINHNVTTQRLEKTGLCLNVIMRFPNIFLFENLKLLTTELKPIKSETGVDRSSYVDQNRFPRSPNDRSEVQSSKRKLFFSKIW